MLTFPHACRFDDTVHPTLESLYAHLKRFRVSRAKYFTTYYPRTDKLTGQPIPFKDTDQYLTQDFLSKVTLRKWLGQHPTEGLEWSKAWLARRRAEKGLIYAPSQTELRTLQCPSMPYYESVGVVGEIVFGLCRGGREHFSAISLHHPVGLGAGGTVGSALLRAGRRKVKLVLLLSGNGYGGDLGVYWFGGDLLGNSPQFGEHGGALGAGGRLDDGIGDTITA